MYDVVIIGAGLSGLTAARDCQAANLTVKVLEARDRVGGKTWSVPLHSGKGSLDLGAAWINPATQRHVAALAKEFALDTIEQNTRGKVAFLGTHGAATSFAYGALPALSEAEVQDIQHVRDEVQRACLTVNVRNWREDPAMVHLAHISLLEYVQGMSKTDASIHTVSVWTRAMLGLEPGEVSALFCLDYFRSGGSLLEMRSDKSDGAQYLRFTRGTQQLAKHLAASLQGDAIVLSSPVTRIRQAAESVTVSCINGSSYQARKVIATLPSPLYSTITWVPEQSPGKAVVGKSLHGYYTKVILVYARPWWRDLGFCGLSQSFERGPVAVTRDTSNEVSQWSLTCFVAGEPGRQWSLMPHKRRVECILDQVTALFTSEEARNTTEIHIREWHKEEWSQGAPCPAQSPETAMEAHQNVRQSERHVHFAGTETAFFWTGYMDGAVESGHRAASEVVAALIQSNQQPTFRATRYRETKL